MSKKKIIDSTFYFINLKCKNSKMQKCKKGEIAKKQ